MKKKTIKKWVLAGALAVPVILAGCIAKDRWVGGQAPSSASLEKFAASVRRVDGQAESHYKMALYFQKNRRHKLAIEELNRALKLNPSMAKAHNAMGISFDKLRRHDDAVRSYFAASKIDPTLDYVHNNLGYSQLLRGNHQKAIKAFHHAIRLNGENKRYRNNLALAYVMNEQYELAAEQFSLIDDEAEAKAKMARLLDNLGKGETDPEVDRLFEEKEDTRIAAAEPGADSPVVVRKAINPGASQAPADEAATDVTSAENAPAETAQPVIVHIPALEEEAQDGETMMTAVAVDTGEELGRNSSTIKWVPWQEGRTKEEENSASGLSASSLSALETQPLHVSAVRIAAGKAAEPVAAAPAQAAAERQETPPPKIVEVARIEAPPAMLTQLYAVRPVTAVVAVRESEKPASARGVTSTHGANADSGTNTPETRVIHVAAAEPQKSAETLAPAEPKPALGDVEVELEIANGNGVSGMARKVAKYLEIRGFKVAAIKNAHSMDHLHTKVLYSSGGKRDLDRLLDELTVIRDVSNLIELEHLGGRIRVVVGKDMMAIQDELALRSLN